MGVLIIARSRPEIVTTALYCTWKQEGTTLVRLSCVKSVFHQVAQHRPSVVVVWEELAKKWDPAKLSATPFVAELKRQFPDVKVAVVMTADLQARKLSNEGYCQEADVLCVEYFTQGAWRDIQQVEGVSP